MTRQDRSMMITTFAVGFLSGFYFYFTGFSFEFSSNLPEENFYSDFSIEGKSYGDCLSDKCMSFQLLADGSYRLIIGESKDSIVKEGFIDRDLRGELMKELNDKSLEKQTWNSLSSANCASAEDGLDYNFKIIRADKEYTLDTCKTNVDYESKSWLSIAKLWDYFEGLSGSEDK